MKSGTRRLACQDCFGQGIRPYVADSTRTHYKNLYHADFIAEDDLQTFYPTYCTEDPKKKAFVRKRICRTCGGTGYIDSPQPWAVELLRNGSHFECCVSAYVAFQQGRAYEENFDYYKNHFKDAAAFLYEIPKLDAKINKMHRRAQKAEGRIAHLEHLYKKARAQADSLREELRRVHGTNHELRSRVPKTVRIQRKLRGEQ